MSSSPEYLRQWGLGQMNALNAWADGATGSGIVVGIIDTGVNPNDFELAGRISPDSTDVIAARNQPTGVNPHATWVATVIAADFNGSTTTGQGGTVGVAYQSTILSIRAESLGSCNSNPNSSCSFFGADEAAGIDYAIGHGAKIVNMSLGGPDPLGTQFENSLSNAVANGLVFTISAGNDGNAAAGPEWPAMYAVDPRYLGSVIAVGATDETGALASFSNPAGAAASGYLVAPGQDIVACTGGTVAAPQCVTVSGTSFSAPNVAGALALLLGSFPNLTGAQALQILENTANHTGIYANSALYGFGLIDLHKAFQAQGDLSVPQATGQTVTVQGAAGSQVAQSFGDVFTRTGSLETIGYDKYHRIYGVNLAEGYRTAPRHSISSAIPTNQHSAQVVLDNGVARLSFTTDSAPDQGPSVRGRDDLRLVQTPRSDVSVEADIGRFSFQGWTGQGGLPPAPGLGAGENAFASIAQPDHALRAAYALSPAWSISAEVGGGSPYMLYGVSDLAPSRYDMASARFSRGRFTAELSAGSLYEPEGPLGSFLPRGSTFALPAQTSFTTLRLLWSPIDTLWLQAEAGVGRTHAQGAFLTLNNDTVSSQWSFAARTACPVGRPDCLRFDAEVGQPTRIEGGSFSALLPDIPAHYLDPVTWSQRRFSAAPNGRELDLRLGMARALDRIGEFDLQALGVVDENNVHGAAPNLGVLASWRTSF